MIITENLDILNSKSGYYNDVCYITESDKGTDISLKDRRNNYVEKNITVCQDDCLVSVSHGLRGRIHDDAYDRDCVAALIQISIRVQRADVAGKNRPLVTAWRYPAQLFDRGRVFCKIIFLLEIAAYNRFQSPVIFILAEETCRKFHIGAEVFAHEEPVNTGTDIRAAV